MCGLLNNVHSVLVLQIFLLKVSDAPGLDKAAIQAEVLAAVDKDGRSCSDRKCPTVQRIRLVVVVPCVHTHQQHKL